MIERLKNPCDTCEKRKCVGYRKCEPWIDWFGEEWQVIRYMAGELKARRALGNEILSSKEQ